MTLEALSRPSFKYGTPSAPTPKNLRPNLNFNANVGNQGYNVQAGAGFSNNRTSIGVNAGIQSYNDRNFIKFHEAIIF